MPRVSLIVLSHREELVMEAFRACVKQTDKDREVLVKFYDGPWYAEKMNEAVRGTSGERFAFLCDDDSLHPSWLAKCNAAMDRDGTDIGYTDNVSFGAYRMQLALPDFSRETVALHCVPHFTALTSRALFDKVGGYDGNQSHVDWDFWASCAEVGATASHVREHLFGYRIGANESRNMDNDAAMAMLRRKHPWVAVEGERAKVA